MIHTNDRFALGSHAVSCFQFVDGHLLAVATTTTKGSLSFGMTGYIWSGKPCWPTRASSERLDSTGSLVRALVPRFRPAFLERDVAFVAFEHEIRWDESEVDNFVDFVSSEDGCSCGKPWKTSARRPRPAEETGLASACSNVYADDDVRHFDVLLISSAVPTRVRGLWRDQLARPSNAGRRHAVHEIACISDVTFGSLVAKTETAAVCRRPTVNHLVDRTVAGFSSSVPRRTFQVSRWNSKVIDSPDEGERQPLMVGVFHPRIDRSHTHVVGTAKTEANPLPDVPASTVLDAFYCTRCSRRYSTPPTVRT